MINIAICDDNTTSLKIVSESVAGIFQLHHLEAKTMMFSSAKSLYAELNKKLFDLILLDIEMPGMDGISLGCALRKNGNEIDIIFVSAREDRMYDAFEVQPFGFIRKNSFIKDSEKVINAYIEKYLSRKSQQMIVLNSVKNGSVSVPTNKIVYVEGTLKNQYVYIDKIEEPIVLNGTMKSLETTLVSQGFVRIHSGFLLNLRYLKLIEKTDVTLINGQKLPISRRNITNVKKVYMEFIQSNGGIVY